MTSGPERAGRRLLQHEISAATRRLEDAGIDSPRSDALALAAFVLGVPTLVLAMSPPVPDSFVTVYAAVITRRARRVPLQHIVGTAAFRHLSLTVRPGVFLPRPETELVAEAAITEAVALARRAGPVGAESRDRTVSVVDLCTGTGAIAVSVAHEAPGTSVLAIDVNPDAVSLATENAAGYPQVTVQLGDVGDPTLLAEWRGLVDIVVANPPYIPPDAPPSQPEVVDHDPPLALYGLGPDGLLVPRLVLAVAIRLLRPGGLFVMEHADTQGAPVRAMVGESGRFTRIQTHVDLTGRDRFVTARAV